MHELVFRDTMNKLISNPSRRRRWIKNSTSEKALTKRRASMRAYIREHGANSLCCTTGRNEKRLLDLQEQIDQCKIVRQVPILSYVVDGYCPETNTVYEVYEKHHDKQITKDSERQKEIVQHLNCDFRIIRDFQ